MHHELLARWPTLVSTKDPADKVRRAKERVTERVDRATDKAGERVERAAAKATERAQRATAKATEWRETAFLSTTITYLTTEELRHIEDELWAVQRYRDRTLDRAERPVGSTPVSLAIMGHPLPPTPSGN